MLKHLSRGAQIGRKVVLRLINICYWIPQEKCKQKLQP
nr:MAG TPA: hypothetical protein [Caudoviricetes sp.]